MLALSSFVPLLAEFPYRVPTYRSKSLRHLSQGNSLQGLSLLVTAQVRLGLAKGHQSE